MKRNLKACGFWLMAAACAGGLAAEAIVLMRLRASAQQADARLGQARARLRGLEALSPSPSTANVALSEQGWASAQRVLADIRVDSAKEAGPVVSEEEHAGTAKRAEAFFDLARFVDDLTERCLAEEIEIPDGLRFGFASHATVAPAVELIPLLSRQSGAVEDLMNALISAAPQRIDSVRRERPAATGASGANQGRSAVSSEPGSSPASGDFFVPETQSSIAESLGLTALSFRVGFVGTTACLRRFLNDLAQGEAPWCVTMVDVQPEITPHTNFGGGLQGRLAGSDKNVPLEHPSVRSMPSRFSVTLEWAQGVAGKGRALP